MESCWDINSPSIQIDPDQKHEYETINCRDHEIKNEQICTLISDNKTGNMIYFLSQFWVALKITKDDGADIVDPDDDVTLVNNGNNCFLQYKLYANDKEIERKTYTGIQTQVEKLIKYSDDYSRSTATARYWYPDTSIFNGKNKYTYKGIDNKIQDTTLKASEFCAHITENSRFNKGYLKRYNLTKNSNLVWISIPAAEIFEFFSIRKIMRGITFKVEFEKHRKFEDMLIGTSNSKYNVVFEKLIWKIPKYTPNLITRAQLEKKLLSQEIIKYEWEETITRRSEELKSNDFTHDIIGVNEKPKYIYIIFQKTKRYNSFKQNNMLFDHMDVREIEIEWGNEKFSAIKCDFTVGKLNYIDAYERFLEAGFKNLDVDTGTVVNLSDFASLYPIFCFDVSHHPVEVYEDRSSNNIKVKVVLGTVPNDAFYLFSFIKVDKSLELELAGGKMINL